MDEPIRDLDELKAFVAELKADRAAAKEKERREAWTNFVSLTVVLTAVAAAIATQWAGEYSNRVLEHLNNSTYHQARASDQWAYYQAKSIKQNLYEVARSQAPRSADPANENEIKQQKAFEERIARYEKEKKEIKTEAEDLEKQRDEARKHADVFSKKSTDMGLAVSMLSISIAIASVCMVSRRKPLWFIAILLALGGLFVMIKAWVS